MQTLEITKELRQTLSIKTLHFSYNWNNKLGCKSFSTVRVSNPKKYQLIELYEITLAGKKDEPVKSLGIARLQAITNFYLHQVTAGMSFLDANLSRIDFMQLVEKMYKNKNIDFKRKQMSFLVLQYVSEDEIRSLVENCR